MVDVLAERPVKLKHGHGECGTCFSPLHGVTESAQKNCKTNHSRTPPYSHYVAARLPSKLRRVGSVRKNNHEKFHAVCSQISLLSNLINYRFDSKVIRHCGYL